MENVQAQQINYSYETVQFRFQCLELAARLLHGEAPAVVVAAAESFSNFLTPAASTAPPA